MFMGVLDPTGKLLAARYGTGRIIGKTKINKIDVLLRWLGGKVVFSSAGHVNDPFVTAVLPRRTGVPGHDIGIDIYRVNRIGDCDFVLVAENIQNKTAIGF